MIDYEMNKKIKVANKVIQGQESVFCSLFLDTVNLYIFMRQEKELLTRKTFKIQRKQGIIEELLM